MESDPGSRPPQEGGGHEAGPPAPDADEMGPLSLAGGMRNGASMPGSPGLFAKRMSLLLAKGGGDGSDDEEDDGDDPLLRHLQEMHSPSHPIFSHLDALAAFTSSSPTALETPTAVSAEALFAGAQDADAAELRRMVEEARFLLSQRDSEVQELQDSVADRSQQLAALKRDKTQSDEKWQQLRSANAKLQSEVERLEKAQKDLQRDRDAVLCEKYAISLKQEDENKHHQQEVGEVAVLNKQLKAQTESLEKEVKSLKADRKFLENQLVDIKVKVATTKARLDDAEAQLVEYVTRLKKVDPTFTGRGGDSAASSRAHTPEGHASGSMTERGTAGHEHKEHSKGPLTARGLKKGASKALHFLGGYNRRQSVADPTAAAAVAAAAAAASGANLDSSPPDSRWERRAACRVDE
mmetsp:Transcript_11315/g.24894  ORF Transcript_11315/g.24894 Transcript_11315/m.24894 type:complete len:409 (-) Transcript_11315:153-1379(-)